MPDPVLRFAVGTPDDPRAVAWRLWVRKNDVYLAARTIAGRFKFSMHASGEWISAWTSQSGAVIPETGSRRHKSWQRPVEFRPGWTLGPAVMAPWVEWVGELPTREDYPRDTVWAPAPGERQSADIVTLFSAPGVDPNEINTVAEDGDVILGSLPLANGGRVWLLSRIAEMSEGEIAGISSAEKQFRGFNTTSNNGWPAMWALWITSSPVQGTPLLIQFPLGRRHITIDRLAELAGDAREPGRRRSDGPGLSWP